MSPSLTPPGPITPAAKSRLRGFLLKAEGRLGAWAAKSKITDSLWKATTQLARWAAALKIIEFLWKAKWRLGRRFAIIVLPVLSAFVAIILFDRYEIRAFGKVPGNQYEINCY